MTHPTVSVYFMMSISVSVKWKFPYRSITSDDNYLWWWLISMTDDDTDDDDRPRLILPFLNHIRTKGSRILHLFTKTRITQEPLHRETWDYPLFFSLGLVKNCQIMTHPPILVPTTAGNNFLSAAVEFLQVNLFSCRHFQKKTQIVPFFELKFRSTGLDFFKTFFL